MVGPDTVIRPERDARGADAGRVGLRHPLRRSHRGLRAGRRGHDPRPLPGHGRAYCRGSGGRSVRAPAAGHRNLRGGARVGNFVELKKTRLGRRVEGEPPGVSRRRDDRREGEHRRRHDHLQLRRRPEAPDGDRGRGVHRQRLAARSRRSRSAAGPTWRPGRRSPRTSRPARWASRAGGRRTRKAGRR